MTALPSLAAATITDYVTNRFDGERDRLQVVLTDGTALSGWVGRSLPPSLLLQLIEGIHQQPGAQQVVGTKEFEELGAALREPILQMNAGTGGAQSPPNVSVPPFFGNQLSLVAGRVLVLVPIDRICGLIPLGLERPQEPLVVDALLNDREESFGPVHHALDRQTDWAAADQGLLTLNLPQSAEVRTISNWRGLRHWTTPRGYTPLYTEWDWWSHRAGGLRSLGGQVGIFGLSGGAEPSLESEVREAVMDDPHQFSDVCTETEVTIEGNVTLPETVRIGSEDALHVEMDGYCWDAKIVTAAREASQGTDVGWALVYFVANGTPIRLPYDQWSGLGRPIRVFGDVRPVAIVTDQGEASCYVTARAAAAYEPVARW